MFPERLSKVSKCLIMVGVYFNSILVYPMYTVYRKLYIKECYYNIKKMFKKFQLLNMEKFKISVIILEKLFSIVWNKEDSCNASNILLFKVLM